jgi:poly[(R)-3-hydroxyalkanoate] polymerase subunit PhaC
MESLLKDVIATFLRDQQATWLRAQRRFSSRMLSLPRVAALAATTPSGVTPHDVVFEQGTLRLLRYRRATPATMSHPLLFCYALINRPYILDLLPNKSVVQRYLEQGFEVFMIDWGVPSENDRGLTLQDYVCGKLASVVEFILRDRCVDQLHLLGYCMGGTLASLFTALDPGLVRTLTLLATPIDFSDRRSLLDVWTDESNFDVDAFVDAHGNCPASFLQACFLSLKPVENLLEKQLAFFEQVDDPDFVAGYQALERWLNDNIPVAGETFREFVKHLFQQNLLVRGQMKLAGRNVDLARIDCPLLLLTASKDHLVPPQSTERMRHHVGSRDVTVLAMDAGHVGLVVSGRAHRSFWPDAVRWLGERSQPRLPEPGGSHPS